LPFDKLKVPSTAEGLRVDPERRFFTPPSKAGLGATERVNINCEGANIKKEGGNQEGLISYFPPPRPPDIILFF